MFEKRANFVLTEFQPLNTPFLPDFMIDQQIKVAENIVNRTANEIEASQKEAIIDTQASFDLEAEIKNHPDSLYVKCFAIKADEENDNGDYFSQEELIKATNTFVGVPVFTNHQNSDINQARGKVIHSWWDGNKNGIMIIARVDAEAYPQLARGIKEDYITKTSMGASRGSDLVTMSDGSKKRVDDVQIGNLVITHSGQTEPVTYIVETQEHTQLYHIRWNGSKTGLALSYEHPVWALREGNADPKFIPASELKSDDYVLELVIDKNKTIEDKKNSFFYKDQYIAHRIKDVVLIGNSEPTYYMQIGETADENSDHSYILNDIATHNCKVHHSVCSICHNYATVAEDYCSCIKERKTRTITAKKVKCSYHKNAPTDDPCPICGSTKKEAKTFDVLEKKAFEYNYGIEFIENSFVTSPACHDCGVTDVIDITKFQKKVAEISERLPKLLKAASEIDAMCDDKKCVKVAGQEQLNKLNDALNLLTSVSTDMLQQKDQIDLEFLSDLVKVLADLQGVTDELTQQGYGRLPSPGQSPQQVESSDEGQPGQMSPVNPTPGGGSKIQTGPAGAAGTVTTPMAFMNKNMLNKVASNIMSGVKRIQIGLDRIEKPTCHIQLKIKKQKLL